MDFYNQGKSKLKSNNWRTNKDPQKKKNAIDNQEGKN